jgi:hypothetical protein
MVWHIKKTTSTKDGRMLRRKPSRHSSLPVLQCKNVVHREHNSYVLLCATDLVWTLSLPVHRTKQHPAIKVIVRSQSVTVVIHLNPERGVAAAAG